MSTRFSVARLEEFTAQVLVALGVLDEHAGVTARRLVEADLRDRTGHGIIRLPLYAERIEAGGINLRPNIRILHETPVSALVDGDNGLGQVVMTLAVETAIVKAKTSGLAWVGTWRSNHAGAAGVYTALAMREDLIGIYCAVASANVMPPWGGRERLLGTNPVAVAIPAGNEVPFQLDIATTVASHGTIKVKALAGEPMPEGWVIDMNGEPVTDPERADEGFLMPIGGYKGSGLNFAIGVLAGIINGAAFGRETLDHRAVYDVPANTGQAIVVIRPDLFLSLEEFKGEMDRQLRVFRGSESMTDDPVRLAGERAAAIEAERRQDGVPVPDPLVAKLRSLAERLGLDDRLDEKE
ncbi:MAG TPA: Ldh family oxidoreductase [Acidimicrobiia bacterium]|nr:Ldh family oxidoreductase [Acidimicrobiia bacterium]